MFVAGIVPGGATFLDEVGTTNLEHLSAYFITLGSLA